ncbi:MAG: hypothetical protein V1835_01920 [Candidatus Micrarchaeota archaeon]
MRKISALFLAVFVISQGAFAAADSIFMDCPTVFNDDISNITANIFISTPGNPPTGDCGQMSAGPDRFCNDLAAGTNRFNITIDNTTDDLISCECDNLANPGSWKISISTPLQKDYNITATVTNTTDAISASYSCKVKRASFQGQFTVPEYSPLLLPLLMFGAILVMRKTKKEY